MLGFEEQRWITETEIQATKRTSVSEVDNKHVILEVNCSWLIQMTFLHRRVSSLPNRKDRIRLGGREKQSPIILFIWCYFPFEAKFWAQAVGEIRHRDDPITDSDILMAGIKCWSRSISLWKENREQQEIRHVNISGCRLPAVIV